MAATQETMRAASVDGRLQYLKQWAAVKMPPFRKVKRLRMVSRLVGPCWACRSFEALVSHHVIQLQHGGNNDVRNIVLICEWCHAAIHPWLRAPEPSPEVTEDSPCWKESLVNPSRKS